ncbi:OsmC family protein [Pseudomonas sp. MF5691]|nr:OsmC family protein [Pseudomonas sp. MF6768]MBJ2262460.1 OsmC family protein [Pseudomonas sp. MF6787]MBJ2288662.1 OsmC family protein [Pseudomonas sp. MF5691]MBK3452047.1 OsmC family protein [Pseudomonas sp. MF6754]QXH88521.1 OsmC family protein [Pseudomonas shahriarae]QYM67991.1 OsmC family protein [Pseudomonas sp. So3.2b]
MVLLLVFISATPLIHFLVRCCRAGLNLPSNERRIGLMNDSTRVNLRLEQQHDYRCTLHFEEGAPTLTVDEPPPLGEAVGPSPVELLLGAVANCLTNSLLFALRKYKQDAEPLSCKATAEVGRNAENRLRVLHIDIELQLGKSAAKLEHLPRILGQFESFCTVTQSVAQGIPVQLRVIDSEGLVLKGDLHASTEPASTGA